MSLQATAALGDRLVQQTAHLMRVSDRVLERKVIPYLKESTRMPVVPAQAVNLAGQTLRQTSADSRLRPALLLAAASLFDQAGEVITVIHCLEEFFRLRRLWGPEDGAAEPAACQLLAGALWRRHQHAAAVDWYDRAAVLYLLSGQNRSALGTVHAAARCCLITGSADAVIFLDRMDALINPDWEDARELAALVTAARAWRWLNLRQWAAAMENACGVLERDQAPAEARAQAAWVAGKVALAYQQRALAVEFSFLTLCWSQLAGWAHGLRLAGSLESEYKASQRP